MLNLPNALTMGRVVLVPLLVGAFYLDAPLSNWITLAIFAVASITDYFDGWFARRRDQFSAFGRFLDPVADKLLVAAAIFMLAATDGIDGAAVIAAVIILSREFVVSGLREFLADLRVSLPVTKLAKWKTAVQMVAIGFLLVGDAVTAIPTRTIGEVCLWAAAVLTLVTGYGYLTASLEHFGAKPGSVAPADDVVEAPVARPPRRAGGGS